MSRDPESGSRRCFQRGGWSVVVLQQAPSSVEANRQLLIYYARKFDELDRGVGARTALYMVWPTADRQQDFQRSSDSYRLAARVVNGLLVPVGDARREAWKRDSTLQPYSSDGLYPSVIGSYLAALVIYQGLYGKSALPLPSTVRLRNGALLSVDASTADQLKAAAAAVMS